MVIGGWQADREGDIFWKKKNSNGMGVRESCTWKNVGYIPSRISEKT